jgi:hypothetical protein
MLLISSSFDAMLSEDPHGVVDVDRSGSDDVSSSASCP